MSEVFCVLRSKLYPPYSLNVSSMYLKMGRIYRGVERHSEAVSAFKKVSFTNHVVRHKNDALQVPRMFFFFFYEQALAIMEVAHGKDHPYVKDVRREMGQK